MEAAEFEVEAAFEEYEDTTPARAEAQDEGATGEPVTLAKCPPGLFLWNGTLGFKSEYGAMEPVDLGKTWTIGNGPDAYCADSGEYFWGGTSNHADRAKVLVMPIDAARAHPSPTPAADADRVLQDLADRVTAEVKRGADGSHVQALGALSNIEGLVLAALKSEGK